MGQMQPARPRPTVRPPEATAPHRRLANLLCLPRARPRTVDHACDNRDVLKPN